MECNLLYMIVWRFSVDIFSVKVHFIGILWILGRDWDVCVVFVDTAILHCALTPSLDQG